MNAVAKSLESAFLVKRISCFQGMFNAQFSMFNCTLNIEHYGYRRFTRRSSGSDDVVGIHE